MSPHLAPLLLALLPTTLQQSSPRSYAAVDVPPLAFDNVAGRILAFATAPIQPMEFSPDGSVLYVVNQPASRLEMLDPATLHAVGRVAIGLGPSAVVARPGSSELWVVDSVDACVNVVDPAISSVVRTIRVGAEPYGLAFTPDGDRAYVTCSGADRVDVIDGSTYGVATSIAIPARRPRGIAYVDGRAWVVPFQSGNGTAPRGRLADPDAVDSVGRPALPGELPLPDRDLFSIVTSPTPEQDTLDVSATVSGLGTTLFDVRARPGTDELWIPNTDAMNADHRGERNFVAGQVVRNRITIVDRTGASPPRFVDLDAITPAGHKCAQPTSVEFDPYRPLAYVSGYGSDSITVLRIAGDGTITWKGSIDLPASRPYPRGTGPRVSRVDPSGTALLVFNKNDGSASRIPLASLPASGGWTLTAPSAIRIGLDLTSGFERLGRHLFTNARLSASETTSCASCHVDGHSDGLVWDLGTYLDPEGTPDSGLRFPIDAKGPMVTQSVRRMLDSGPYHWRGEIRSTNGFADSFASLLEHDVNGSPGPIGPDFQYLRHFMDRLVYPPNPRQSLDRELTPEQRLGYAIFTTRPVTRDLTCASCHALPLGTSGEVLAERAPGRIGAADVPSLRGAADRLSPAFDVGGAYGVRSELGAGLTHGGAFPTVAAAIHRSASAPDGEHDFALSPTEVERVSAFVEAFDSGVAPTACTMVTADAANWSQIASGTLPLLEASAAKGHCDLVYYRVPRDVLGTTTQLAGAYDPATGRYRVASSTAPTIDRATLLAEAAGGLPVSFLGVPVGMGESRGLDQDMDGLFDLDEIAAQTDPQEPDTDHDGFADGYEVLWGMDPLVTDASSPDAAPPALLGPARLVYATTNSLKFEFETDEFCFVQVSYNNGPVVRRLPLNQYGDHRHWVVLGELAPETSYQISLAMRDPAGNVAVDSSTVFRTQPRATPEPARIRSIDLSPTTLPVGVPAVHAEVQVYRRNVTAGPGYQVVANVYWNRIDGSLVLVGSDVESVTDATGSARVDVRLPPADASPGRLYFAIQRVIAPPGGVPWVEGLDFERLETLRY